MSDQMVLWISCAALIAAICGCSSCASSPKKAPPTITFSASATTISSGQSVTLNWQAFNGTSRPTPRAHGPPSQTVVSGSQTSGNAQDSPTQTTTYTAVASGPGGP